MLAAFQGKCHTCGFDHDLLDALNTPNEGRYRAMYEAQCVATDEWAEKARKRSDPVLKERIKELEEQLAQANQTIGRLNQQLIGDVLSNLE